MKSLPIQSDTILDNPSWVVHTSTGIIFSIHVALYDAKHNTRVIQGSYRKIDWDKEEPTIWEAELYR